MTSMKLRPDDEEGYPGRNLQILQWLYPFGHGLSYTQFNTTLVNCPTPVNVKLVWNQHCHSLASIQASCRLSLSSACILNNKEISPANSRAKIKKKEGGGGKQRITWNDPGLARHSMCPIRFSAKLPITRDAQEVVSGIFARVLECRDKGRAPRSDSEVIAVLLCLAYIIDIFDVVHAEVDAQVLVQNGSAHDHFVTIGR
ncbi:beta-xylosidase/alpha-L-arabinofuranosidase 1-like protein [Cinnamomum micranthum f. kanehirae]|uniref:Beta-xylosidase/alpha-L-arabinofuranosidase 1-like protein n=1 Tax=Cinnamomum micranthum f. kanehirae TaxID=337451 RepID=A0A443PUG7_9MAGN|nr:beta-xylosidase/alpha-L-arabinofuranosidase 1-like protein [Cinnamomum micranthum f. kanehirae]